MTELFLILGIALILIITNYTAFIYGVRIGKSMQKDIPPVPIEPVARAAKKAYTVVNEKIHKSYIQKKEVKKDDNENPLFN